MGLRIFSFAHFKKNCNYGQKTYHIKFTILTILLRFYLLRENEKERVRMRRGRGRQRSRIPAKLGA